MNLNFKLLGYKLKKGKTKPINISFSHEPGFNDVITINLQFLKDQKHVEERLFRKLYGGKQERLEEVIEEIEDFSKEITNFPKLNQ